MLSGHPQHLGGDSFDCYTERYEIVVYYTPQGDSFDCCTERYEIVVYYIPLYIFSVTPYKFTATLNTTVHASQSVKKSAFDLQASLAKPLTWRPHKGKLKPFGEKSPAKKPAIGQSVSKSRFVIIDFSLTVNLQAATLIFISGRGSAISSAKEGKSGFIYN